jgi:membrane associated rhomboid family serine protease
MLQRFTSSPPVVLSLLIANGIVYLLSQWIPIPMLDHFALWPLGLPENLHIDGLSPQFQIWQLVSYSFLHSISNPLHILINMYVLWMFGTRIELVWGSRAFVIYYFVCVVGAGLVQLVVSTLAVKSGELYPTVGASGGVFGLLLAFALTFPEERLMLLFPPVILKAKWLALIYAAIELVAGVTGTLEGIAHFAHLGGMLFGFLLLLYWGRHPLKR